MAELNLTDRVQNLLTDMERPDSLPLLQAGMNFNNGKPSFNASSPLMDMMPRRDTLGSGVMTDREAEMIMGNLPETVKRNKSLLSGVPDPMMSGVDTSIMQPLVEMGFEQQVRVILSTPQNSPESIQAQQEIINEMGTGMDIDAFVQTVQEVAPPAVQEELLQNRMQTVGSEDAEGVAQLLKFAVKQKVDESGNPLLKLGIETGRMNDTTLGHLSEGEAVIPAEVLEANPQAAQSLDQTMIEMGINPDSRIVDTTGQISGIASINPETGLQEFGIGSAFQKLRRKVLKPVAKIAAVVPGPWQAPAIIYNKAESVYNIGKGEGGIGDLMTVMAGGSQKVFGKDGAISNLGKANFGADAGFMDSLKGIGSVDGKFAPLQYGKNIAKTYRDDQVGGYFGLLGGGGEQAYEIQPGDNLTEIARANGTTVEAIMQANGITDPNMIQAGATLKLPGGGGTNPFIKSIGDKVGLGGRSGLEDAYGIGTGTQVDKNGNVINTGTTGGGMGMMGKLGIAGLAGLIGKLAYEEAKDQKGVPLTPLTQMDQLGRYNIAAEMARQAGEGSPSRVEYGLSAEGMPALSGGAPRMARYGGIMAFANGGSVAMAEGGDPMIDISPENFPMKDGQIDGPGTETSDDIPAMLSDGEFVMTAKAVRGAGSFDVNDNNGILTLTPNGTPTRDSGTRVMYKLMEHFGSVA